MVLFLFQLYLLMVSLKSSVCMLLKQVTQYLHWVDWFAYGFLTSKSFCLYVIETTNSIFTELIF